MPLTPRDKRALIILGVIAGVAVAVFLVLNLFGGGDEEEQALPTPSVAPTVAPSPTVSVSPTPRQTPPPVAGGRDPFSIPPELAPTPGGGESPTGTTTPPTTTSPTTSPPTSPGGGSSATVDGHTVVLLDIFTRNGVQKAQVEVDGTVYTVDVGESFDDGFRLTSISGDCADFVSGDGEDFTLCVSPQK